MNHLVIAFGFANLAALGWLAAAAAPILIHLWMRQTNRETAWAAIRFLQAALERQARRLRLQHWLLLAVRTAILLLVALAAAKPFLEGGLLAGAGGAPTHRVLVVDTSLSMNYAETLGGEKVTRLYQAQRLAKDWVSQARPGDVFSLVTMANEATSLIGSPVADSSAVVQAIDRIEPTHAAADLTRALSMAASLLETHSTPASVHRNHEVIFFTDLDAKGWEGLGEAKKNTNLSLSSKTPSPSPSPESGGGKFLAQSNGVRQLYEKLAETASVTVVDVGRPNATNTAVTQLRIVDAAPTSGRPLTFAAEATLFGGDSPRETVAQLLVDGQQVAEQPLTLVPHRSTLLEFVHVIDGPGWRSVEVQLDADDLTADDVSCLAFDFRPQIRVLCVAGASGAARYVADALSATRGETGDEASPYLPLTISDADLPTIDLEDFDCLFFCNVAELSRDEATRIQRYLEGGGGVVFFLGDRVDAARYNEVLGSDGLGSVGGSHPFRVVSQTTGVASVLLPVKIGEAITRPSFGIDPLDYAHPIAEPFRDQQRAGLLTTPISRYYQLILPEQGENSIAPQVALALNSGDPLLVTQEVTRGGTSGGAGGGRIAVMATDGSLASIDPATGEPWTAMPAWPSFLPIVRGLVQYVSSSATSGGRIVAGQVIGGRLPLQALAPDALKIQRPDDTEAVVSPSSDGDWSYAGANKVGVYHLMPSDQSPESEPLLAIAVNADPTESQLRRVAVDRLPDSLIIRSGTDAGASQASSLAAPASLHRWLLQAALALVLIDTALACYFGRGGGA